MYHQLATRFGRNAHQISGREPLDNEALYRHVPSIFAREAHDSRSDRYVYVPTIDIVEGVRREGWFPFFAVQSVPRDGSRHGHAKHMLRLRRADGIGKPEAAEVIIVNSHDGTSAYQMFAGMLRFVCTNSMIAGERFEEVRVPHKGNIEHDIIEGVYTVAEDFPRLVNGGAKSGHGGGVKVGQRSRCDDDMERAPIGALSMSSRPFSPGYVGGISPVFGSADTVAWFCSALLAERRPADCLRR